MDLAELIALRDALVRERAAGTRSVEWSDSNGGSRKVTYGSDLEMTRALSDLERRIAAAATGDRPTTIRFATSKGV